MSGASLPWIGRPVRAVLSARVTLSSSLSVASTSEGESGSRRSRLVGGVVAAVVVTGGPAGGS
jgi:hypothetical protein